MLFYAVLLKSQLNDFLFIRHKKGSGETSAGKLRAQRKNAFRIAVHAAIILAAYSRMFAPRPDLYHKRNQGKANPNNRIIWRRRKLLDQVKMKKSRFFKIYNRDKLNTALGLRPGSQTGVYLIKENETIVYVGHSSSNLYKTFTRHFQSWEDRQHRTTYANRSSDKLTARVIFTTPAKARALEKALVLKYQPRDNVNKYEQFILDLKDRELIQEADKAPAYNFNQEDPPF